MRSSRAFFPPLLYLRLFVADGMMRDGSDGRERRETNEVHAPKRGTYVCTHNLVACSRRYVCSMYEEHDSQREGRRSYPAISIVIANDGMIRTAWRRRSGTGLPAHALLNGDEVRKWAATTHDCSSHVFCDILRLFYRMRQHSASLFSQFSVNPA
jgi:hypothetical protein